MEKQLFNVSQKYHSRRGKVRNEAGRQLGEGDSRLSDKLQGQIYNRATRYRVENGWTRGKIGAAGLGSAPGHGLRRAGPGGLGNFLELCYPTECSLMMEIYNDVSL